MNSGGHNKKKVRVVEINEEFESQSDCADVLGLNLNGINDCLRGRQQTHQGLHFEYVNDE